MSNAQADTTASASYSFPFDRQMFVTAFADSVQPLILKEWPDLSADALSQTGGDPEKVVDAIAAQTDHSRALIRKHLVEIAQVAGVGATGLETRLLELIRQLEQTAGLQERAERTREAVRELGEQGKHVIEEVRQVVPQAEEKMKDNVWTVVLAALGLGMLVGLVVGLTRGK
ncbi:MAG: hypothetical protein AAFV53_25325 [Myxococcota bacterium]